MEAKKYVLLFAASELILVYIVLSENKKDKYIVHSSHREARKAKRDTSKLYKYARRSGMA